ncbi:hypothetical protein ABZX62_00965 [Streptomyces flavidovirens]|uniref:hypothetical protein n=1 Tax=Streptomyces flavidovirens TaxID=67298 RepID=UPI00339FDAFE
MSDLFHRWAGKPEIGARHAGGGTVSVRVVRQAEEESRAEGGTEGLACLVAGLLRSVSRLAREVSGLLDGMGKHWNGAGKPRASLWVSPGVLSVVGTKKRHEMNGAEMHQHEAAEIAARMDELEGKLGLLEELARQVAELLAATSSASR